MPDPLPDPVALYARVSSDEQATAGTIQTQVEFFRRWADLHQRPIAGEYLDDGVRGIVPWQERPEARRLLADVAAGKVREVAVFRVDRIGRELRVILDAFTALEEHGCVMRSMTEPFDTANPAGKLIIAMLAAFAGFERESILQRAREGQKRKARNGGWVGGSQAAYGYRIEGKGHTATLVIDESPAPGWSGTKSELAAWIFAQVAEGRSAVELAAQLTAQGVPSAKGGAWAPAVIARMIHNPVYKGEHHYGDDPGATSDLAGLTCPAPALVTPDLWRLANNALTRNRRLSRTTGARDYLLRGLIFCGHCGSAYTGLTLPGYKDIADETDHQRGVLYRCNAKTYKGRTCTESKSVPGSLESTVWEACRYWLQRPEEVTALLATQASRAGMEQPSHTRQRDQLRATLAGKQEERTRVARAHRRGLYDDDTAGAMLEEIGQEEKLLHAELARLDRQEQMVVELGRQRQEIAQTLATLANKLTTSPSRAERRAVIEALVERITVTTAGGEPDVVVSFRFLPAGRFDSHCDRETQPEGQINQIQLMVTDWKLPELEQKLRELSAWA